MSVAQLPFITTPVKKTTVVGNAEIGELEFPVFNGLTVAETSWLQQSGATKTAFAFTARCALKIAKEEKIRPIDAHSFVAKVLAGGVGANVQFNAKEENWQVKYLPDLEQAGLEVLEVSVKNQIALVTTVIRHRLEGQDEWDIASTQTLPQALVDAIYTFAVGEQQGGVEYDEEKAKEELAEALGKSQKGPTKKRSRSTGRKPSTTQETSTPQIETSPVSDSETSSLPTSSTV